MEESGERGYSRSAGHAESTSAIRRNILLREGRKGGNSAKNGKHGLERKKKRRPTFVFPVTVVE